MECRIRKLRQGCNTCIWSVVRRSHFSIAPVRSYQGPCKVGESIDPNEDCEAPFGDDASGFALFSCKVKDMRLRACGRYHLSWQ